MPPSLHLSLAAQLDQALGAIAAGAAELDREPRFPAEALAALGATGALSATIGAARAEELGAAEPGSWCVASPPPTPRSAASSTATSTRSSASKSPPSRSCATPSWRSSRAAAACSASGAPIPAPGEGAPARIVETGAGLVLRGAKTFCSGAGGVDAALVMVGDDDGAAAPLLVLVECDDAVEVDRDWYRAAGMRASESHRVVFRDAPVVAVLGEPGELGREPWFSRDAMRTAASWAGMVDAAAEAAIADLAAAPRRGAARRSWPPAGSRPPAAPSMPGWRGPRPRPTTGASWPS